MPADTDEAARRGRWGDPGRTKLRPTDRGASRRAVNSADHADEIATNPAKYGAALRSAGYDTLLVLSAPMAIEDRIAPLEAAAFPA